MTLGRVYVPPDRSGSALGRTELPTYNLKSKEKIQALQSVEVKKNGLGTSLKNKAKVEEAVSNEASSEDKDKITTNGVCHLGPNSTEAQLDNDDEWDFNDEEDCGKSESHVPEESSPVSDQTADNSASGPVTEQQDQVEPVPTCPEPDEANHVDNIVDNTDEAQEQKNGVESEAEEDECNDDVSPPEREDSSERKLKLPLAGNAKGLKNLGNTCYMNSIIQCLAHTRKLLDFCQNFDFTSQPSSDKSDKIIRSFSKLVLEMWKNGQGGIADPTVFRREICSFAPKFAGFDQHDSQEFLQYLMEGLHSEVNRKEPPQKGDKSNKSHQLCDHNQKQDDRQLSANHQGFLSWQQYLKHDDSLITDLFLGQFRSTLRCCECGHESVTFEPFWVVSVSINPKTSKDLTDCFELFVAEEILDGEEKPSCDACKTKTKCTKWYSFERWPHILVVHLKRFAPTGSYRAKLSTHINVPLQNLDLSSFSSGHRAANTSIDGKSNGLHVQPDNSSPGHEAHVMYDLYGISNHSGSLHGGHYTAYCRHPELQPSRWFLYNDRSVSPANHEHIVTSEAYLLFFHKKMLSS